MSKRYTFANARTTIRKEGAEQQSSSQQLIVMEMHATGADNRTQEVRHYPARTGILQPTYGNVKVKGIGGTGSFPNTERLSVSGNSVSVSYPPVDRPNLITDGQLFDETGSPTTFKVTSYDKKSGTFTFGDQLYGTLIADYTTDYVILQYTPKAEGNTDIYGEIMSWYNGGFARFDVPPPNKPDDLDRVRFCAVVRKVFVDNTGRWEYHPDFTEEKGYQYFSGDEKPEEDGMTVETEIDVYIRYAKAGDLTLFSDNQGWSLLKPKIGTYYKPDFIFTIAPRPSQEWAAKLHDETDFDKEYRMLKQLYPTLKRENG